MNPIASTKALGRLEFVIRAPHGEIRNAIIDVTSGVAISPFEGAFDDAVRAAQLLSNAPTLDGIHRQSISQAHALLSAGDGRWLIAPLVGEHRDRVGPVFIDGAFYDRTGLAVHAMRIDPSLQAIVGSHSLIDLRRSARAGVEALPPLDNSNAL